MYKGLRLDRSINEPEANIPPLAVAAAAVGAYVMDHVQVNVNVHFRAADLLDELEVMYGCNLGERQVERKSVDGGIWISGTAGSILFSAYYHPTKKHTARVQAGTDAQVLPSDEEWVEAGQWAIIYTVTNAKEGNVASYEIEREEEANLVPSNPTRLLLPAAIIAKHLSQLESNSPTLAADLPVVTLDERLEANSNIVKDIITGVKTAYQKVTRNGEEAEANIPPVIAAVGAYLAHWAADHVNVNVDFRADNFIDTLEEQLGRKFQNRKINRKIAEGGVWISGTADDVIFSAYYHRSKSHTVAVQRNGVTIPETPKFVAPGKWAVVYSIATSEDGNKALFKVDE